MGLIFSCNIPRVSSADQYRQITQTHFQLVTPRVLSSTDSTVASLFSKTDGPIHRIIIDRGAQLLWTLDSSVAGFSSSCLRFLPDDNFDDRVCFRHPKPPADFDLCFCDSKSRLRQNPAS